ncbi:hypothetical protein DSCOOX_02780 [Desulfosarcina ovata subsp. ovata]|uniref:Uncharacterized protein n=1 Tax=Desulfosarcina ovata subsp. ovata TaxID=2752305 RepID=A0A5K8A3W1_9BACT|nr:hypothetical protein DSCOOX_02780 [Desulfosarcina ovata subsp. ovata]
MILFQRGDQGSDIGDFEIDISSILPDTSTCFSLFCKPDVAVAPGPAGQSRKDAYIDKVVAIRKQAKGLFEDGHRYKFFM